MSLKSKTYGIFCTKGGVGKTTQGANLGAILADMKQRVLLIDADPQQSMSRFFELIESAPYGLSQVYRSASTAGCISNTVIPNLDIILNDDKGSEGKIPNFLRESILHFQHLRHALEQLSEYDYIFIDTQGASGIIQESVIMAADVLLSPIKPQILDSREFIHGTIELVNKFKPKPGFHSITGRPMPPVKVLINLWDRTTTATEVSNHLRCTFDKETDGHVTVLNTVIPTLKAYSEAAGLGIPAHRHEPSREGPTRSALDTLLELVYELEPKLYGIKPEWNA
ncbi:MAG: hypothetical protein B0W54_08150 [Cellvibrio sp. 79]|nr:MAG: hypothetical protein B0W54_08150 [Cellvibrio sp. 79]